MMPRLTASRLTLRAGHCRVCEQLNWAPANGEAWVVLGRNGAGKTTLLHAMAGLRRPDAGDLELSGDAIDALPSRTRAKHIGLLTQLASDPFPTSVEARCLSGLAPHRPWWAWDSAADRAAAAAVLRRMDLAGLETRSTQTLSGGERQRLALATLALQDPDIWLLDEPDNHLDVRHQHGLLVNVLREARAAGKLIVAATHDLNLALRVGTHALALLGDGETRQGPLAELLTAANLSDIFQTPLRRIEQDGIGAIVPS